MAQTECYSLADSMAFQTMKTSDLTCVRKLGTGGFGVVFLAAHKYLGDLAVKVCHSNTMSPEEKNNVRREVVRMAKTVLNGHIVQIRDIIHPPKVNSCIVMEYMEYGSLKCFSRLLTSQQLASFPHPLKIKMIYEIILGMNFLHTLPEPIIHRDLKLDNVFVGRGFTAKVGDLGLATWCTASNFQYKAGTISHIAPENYNINKPYSTKSDVYSFGITLWEFSTNEEPYKHAMPNVRLVENGVSRGQRPDEKKIPHDEPSIVKQMMKKAWDEKPDKRPSFQELKEWIEQDNEFNYKKDIGGHIADVYLQLQLNPEKPSNEKCLFPWEEDVADSPGNGRGEHSPSPTGDEPSSLRSTDEKHSNYVTDTQNGALPGASTMVELVDRVAAIGLTTQPQQPQEEREEERAKVRLDDGSLDSAASTIVTPQQSGPHASSTELPRLGPKPEQKLAFDPSADQYYLPCRGQAISNSGVQVIVADNVTVHSSIDRLSSSSCSSLEEMDLVVVKIINSDEKITEQDLNRVSSHIGGEWKQLGRNLHVNDTKIQNIQSDYFSDGRVEMAYQVMLVWKRGKAKAKKGELAKALVDVGLTEVAVKYL